MEEINPTTQKDHDKNILLSNSEAEFRLGDENSIFSNPSELAQIPGTQHQLPRSPSAASSSTQDIKVPSLNSGSNDNFIRGKSEELSPTSREHLQELAQNLVEEINQKRQKDIEILEGYKNEQMAQVEKFYRRAENQLFEVYKVRNDEVESKLKQLLDTLERIGKLDDELAHFKQMLQSLHKDIIDT